MEVMTSMASKYYETLRVASTAPLEVTYRISASLESKQASTPGPYLGSDKRSTPSSGENLQVRILS